MSCPTEMTIRIHIRIEDPDRNPRHDEEVSLVLLAHRQLIEILTNGIAEPNLAINDDSYLV